MSLDWAAIGTVVTAIATIVLAIVTAVLVRETKRLSDATTQPHVVATLEPSPWSIIHTNLVLQNTGTGTAYSIEVAFDPPLGVERNGQEISMPIRSLSVLKPGASFSVFLNGFENLNERVMDIRVSWLRKPNAKSREGHSYVLDLIKDYDNWGQLGGAPPLIQIAQDMRKIREAISKIARS